jgi:N-acetylmuramoyl-L-alanine amidase
LHKLVVNDNVWMENDMANYKVAIDAGHGGNDPGAVYAGRQEKDDVLRLAMEVGDILEKNGVDVFYVREDDIYETPFKKAQDANYSGADLFVSLHRNSSEEPDQYTGVETLVYAEGGTRTQLANNINSELENVGFKDLGIDERPNLVVLKRTEMPAVLVEVGFINNKNDNALFDNQFDNIAKAIARGIMQTLNQNAAWEAGSAGVAVNAGVVEQSGDGMAPDGDGAGIVGDDGTQEWRCPCEKLYRVQVGAFRDKDNADRMLNSLLVEGFPAFLVYDDGIYKVQVGAFNILSNAIKMEARLRRYRYNTYITV